MGADCFYAMGKTHTVCQDYAAVRKMDRSIRMALSDGCSSSPHTDIGARVLARRSLWGEHDLDFVDPLWDSSHRLITSLGLPRESLDATLLVADIDSREVNLSIIGDGVVDVEHEDPTAVVFTVLPQLFPTPPIVNARQGSSTTRLDVDFPSGAPAYLRYMYREDFEAYAKQFGTERRVNGVPTIVTQGTLGLRWTYPRAGLRRVSLYSDGVRSFRRPGAAPGTWEPVPLAEVLEQINAIKVPAGEFLVRRMQKFLHDFCPKHGWVHDDDVAVATYLETP